MENSVVTSVRAYVTRDWGTLTFGIFRSVGADFDACQFEVVSTWESGELTAEGWTRVS
jgi:hypothetical protein